VLSNEDNDAVLVVCNDVVDESLSVVISVLDGAG
jgi:hypothetical protein